MGRAEQPAEPSVRRSVGMATVLSSVLGHVPGAIQRENLKKFAELSLIGVDRGDKTNYSASRARPRELGAVFLSYYGDEKLYPGGSNPKIGAGDLGYEQARELIGKIVGLKMGQDIPEEVTNACIDWFMANLVWEYLGQGGDINIFLGDNNEWNKYLRSPWIGIPEPTQVFRSEDIAFGWKRKEFDEIIEVYRAVTGYWYTRTICACLGIEGEGMRFQLMDMAGTVYQLLSDMGHTKNYGEPTFLAHQNKQDWSAIRFDEKDWGNWIYTRLGPEVPRIIARPFIKLGMCLGGIIVRQTGKTAEWESQSLIRE